MSWKEPRKTLREGLAAALADIGLSWPDKAFVRPPLEARFGDLTTNAAMLLAREAKRNPRDIAQDVAKRLPVLCPDVMTADVAGPGFINVAFQPSFLQGVISAIEEAGDGFGKSSLGAGKKALVEFVSANPTGPLHVGHGRGAAVGDSLARILSAAGYDVTTEYYLNDAGRQMRTLGLSVWLRLREHLGEKVDFPEDCYKGEYIRDMAAELLRELPAMALLPEDEALPRCCGFAVGRILAGIKMDLASFRVNHDAFFSEKHLVESGAVDAAFAALEKAGYTYEKNDALWFATTRLGDDKDRVLRKSDGSLTYFASDIAYHWDKALRGYDILIDVWGADHHGYVPRMRAALAAGKNPEPDFTVVLIQFVNWLRNGEKTGMSTRSGEFVPLAEVLDETGADAARFLLLSRKLDSPLDFDLEVAKKRSLENPVYYVQYAHARARQLVSRAEAAGIGLLPHTGEQTKFLASFQELLLLRKLGDYVSVTEEAATGLAPHIIANYLTELAGNFHSWYSSHKIIDARNKPLSIARLALARAVGQVIKNGLFLLGVEAPEEMR